MERAREDVRCLEARRPEVDEAVALSRAFKERNHFAEAFDALLKGGRAG